jgi:DNA polymerase-3 subunit alpha
MTGIVHLHVHTEYSLLDGSIRIKDLLKRAKELGHDAVAITDHGNLFGAIELYTKAKELKDHKIKPIIGSEIFHPGTEASRFVAAERQERRRNQPAPALGARPETGSFHLVLLAKSVAGYKNLIKIVSSGYLEGLGEVPVAPEATVDQYSGEMIALSSCVRGELGWLVACLREECGDEPLDFACRDGLKGLINAALDEHVRLMRQRFGEDGYYVELINNNLPEQRKLLPDLVAAARHYGLPLVASADAHYATKDKSEAHAVLIGIKHGLNMTKLRGRRKTAQFHMLDDAEMEQLYGAWPEALANTRSIADRCNVEFKFGQYFLPKFDLGVEGETTDDGFKRIAREMLEERFVTLRRLHGDALDESAYRARLDYELDVICKMGFAGYFLIVQDFINWAKRHDIPVGPGRGSGAGSIVAYALRITDLDPLPYNLLFERFLNPERISMPDFDVDFCQDRRGEVIHYVTEKYGADNVAQITNFGRMKAKAIVRDVGRVLELGYGRVDRIARLIPGKPLDITLGQAMKDEPRIQQEAARDERVAELLKYALELEGLARQTGVHAAGIVISDGPMTDYVPVFKTEEAGLITQFEMKMAEKVGLVKFDFLGLKTLTVIDKAIKLIHARAKPDLDLALIPMDDKKVYQLISAGNSVGIFQLESPGMRKLIMDLQPSCFEDVIAVVALFRPGPLQSGMVEDFIERKHGRAPIEYPLPQLEETLAETYGIMIYQEQVMKIAGMLSGYSLGEADLLRRAMGKKDKALMAKEKEKFIPRAVANGIDGDKAGHIFDLMEKFAEYGFNKSHSAAYGLVTYQTAYLKAHFPDEFMAAIMTCDLGNTSKIVRYVDECRRLKIKVLPPDINSSILEFSIPQPRSILFGLAAIKGVGPQSVEPLVKERQANGPFKSLDDLARRLNLHQVGKKTLEQLTQAGALDGFGISRPKLCAVIPELVRFSEDVHAAKTRGQRSLFDFAEVEDGEDAQPPFEVRLTGPDQRPGAPDPVWLKKEKDLLGVYLSAHPLDFHKEDLRLFTRGRFAELGKEAGKRISITCVLAMLKDGLDKENKRRLNLRLEDQTDAFEAVMFEGQIPEEVPEAGSLVVVTGNVSIRRMDQSVRFALEGLEPLEEKRLEHVASITVSIKAEGDRNSVRENDRAGLLKLRQHLDAHKGDTPVQVKLDLGASALTITPAGPGVEVTDAFLYGLLHLPFPSVEVRYGTFAAQTAAAAPTAPEQQPHAPPPPGVPEYAEAMDMPGPPNFDDIPPW